MKRTVIVTAAVLILTGATGAGASTLTLSPSDTTCTTNNTKNLSASDLYTVLDSCFDVTASSLGSDPLYKSDVGGTETGSYSLYYDSTFWPSGDESCGTIEYTSGTMINCLECYLVVKDGNNQPAQYFFDISGWEGTIISLQNFWPTNGSISNVAIWGVVTSVPEPGTLLLTGMGIAATVIFRRRRSPTLSRS